MFEIGINTEEYKFDPSPHSPNHKILNFIEGKKMCWMLDVHPVISQRD